MFRYLFSFVIILLSANAAASNSPIGYWKTIDDVSGRMQSIIQIYEAPDHTLAGKILKTFPRPDVQPLVNCDLCKGKLQGQPIIGMTIINSLKQEKQNLWSNGLVTDPKSGNIYHCYTKLNNDGDKLTIHGYILFQWLGRSQTWLRTTQPT